MFNFGVWNTLRINFVQTDPWRHNEFNSRQYLESNRTINSLVGYFNNNSMNKRPLLVTLISWLFIVAGTVGIIYHASELAQITSDPEVIWILIVRLLAIVGGIFSLRGVNWARWLLSAWIAYHVALSFSHTIAELIMHCVVLIVTLVALFYPKANAYFREPQN